jgi:hypothetical protein
VHRRLNCITHLADCMTSLKLGKTTFHRSMHCVSTHLFSVHICVVQVTWLRGVEFDRLVNGRCNRRYRPCWVYTSSCCFRPSVSLLSRTFSYPISGWISRCRLGMAKSSFPGKLRCVKWVSILVSLVICFDLCLRWMNLNLD